MRITQFIVTTFVGLLSLHHSFSQYIPKPWPTYSTDNMPRTGFSCHGKILGGYYADSETQCQMFHVCVKVAGVGVKDFRFLCPNGTAFDQESQICADWGDVDCGISSLYYSSDNFDLYRLGSGFESKRAPFDEDEQPFHLQNAESNDFRRTPQQNSGRQSFKRDESPSYNDDSTSYSANPNYVTQRNFAKTRTTSTSTTTTEASYQADRRGDDEIFKGSHSSNFFNNRNNGKEDDLVDFNQRTHQQNRNFNTRGRPRPHNNVRNNFNQNNIPSFPQKTNDVPVEQTATTTTSTTYSPPTTTRFRSTPNSDSSFPNNVKTVSLQSSFRTGSSQDPSNNGQSFFSPTTEVSPFSKTSYQQNNFKLTTQERVQPTTYSPPRNVFNSGSSTPSYETYGTFEKTSTTQGQNFKQPSHNSFYNAQFENKATESYDQLKAQEFVGQQNNFDSVTKSQTTTNDFVRTVPKSNNRANIQRHNSYENRREAYNGQNSYSERQSNFNGRQNTFDERKSTFSENQNEPSSTEQAAGYTAANFEPQQIKPYRARRPTHSRGSAKSNKPTANYNKPTFESDISVSNPLNVRPLEIVTQTTTTTEAPKKLEQQNVYNGFSNSFRPAAKTSQSAAPNYNNSPSQSAAPNNYNSPSAFGLSDISRASPAPFALPNEPRDQQEKQNNTKPNDRFAQNTFQALSSYNESPRGFSLSTPYQSQQQPKNENSTPKESFPKKYDGQPLDNYTPSSQAKKFSTLVPKDQFYPTTFRPGTYKKVIQGYDQKIGTSTKFAAASYLPTTTSTTTFRPQPQYQTQAQSQPQSQNQQANNDKIDEDDGQYHPELYEQEFGRNKFQPRKQEQQPYERTFNRRPTDPPSDTEDDEFLYTAHSLNIAAGANQLRADKNKHSSLSAFKSAPTGFSAPSGFSATTTTTTTTRRPTAAPKKHHSNSSSNKNKKGANEDASYDYAYYDSFSGNPQDYEYDLISEFGKTRKN